MWCAFDHGKSLGTRGPENGMIVQDEEYDQRARITLERDVLAAPWSITCDIYGIFKHTAFASSEEDAGGKYSDMKRDLMDIITMDPSQPCYEKMRLFADIY